MPTETAVSDDGPSLAELMLLEAHRNNKLAPCTTPLVSRSAHRVAGPVRRGFLLNKDGLTEPSKADSMVRSKCTQSTETLAVRTGAVSAMRVPVVKEELACGGSCSEVGSRSSPAACSGPGTQKGSTRSGLAASVPETLIPVLLERMSAEPRLAASLSEPSQKLLQALADFQKNPKAAAATYAGDADIAAFFSAMFGAMGELLTKVGSGATSTPPTRNSVLTPGDMSREAEAGARIGLVEARAPGSTGRPAEPAPVAVDPEVQRALSNAAVRRLLSDPATARLMRECAASPARLRAALARPAELSVLAELRKYGLVRFE